MHKIYYGVRWAQLAGISQMTWAVSYAYHGTMMYTFWISLNSCLIVLTRWVYSEAKSHLMGETTLWHTEIYIRGTSCEMSSNKCKSLGSSGYALSPCEITVECQKTPGITHPCLAWIDWRVEWAASPYSWSMIRQTGVACLYTASTYYLSCWSYSHWYD